MKRAFLALFFVLSACSQPPSHSGPPFAVAPDEQGLGVQGSGLRIDFGRSPQGAIRALDRGLGPHADLSLSNCPPEVARHAGWGNLVLTFTAERFVGWRQQNGNAQGLVCRL